MDKQLYTTHRKVKNKNDIKWEEKFKLLCQYKEEFGDCYIPQNFIYKGVNLGKWCDAQRFRKVRLSQERIDKLNSIGFIWDLNDKRWNNMFELLCQYKEEFGDCYIPINFLYKGVNLGKWCNTQRYNFKDGTLSQERIDKLNSIGFIWELNNDTRWNNMFDLLCQYKEEFGDCDVPYNFIYKGFNLGLWCDKQRQAFGGKNKHKLTKERIDKLNSIGFSWESHINRQWNNMFDLLCQYKEEFGDCDVPYNFIYKGANLGSWCNTQRQALKKNDPHKLTKERIDKLNSIGFPWRINK